MKSEKTKPSVASRITILLVFGICVSAYLVYHHAAVVGGFLAGPSFCNIGGDFDCDAVARSSYSEIFGFPVASFGLLYYLGFLLLVVVAKLKRKAEDVSLLAAFAIVAFIGLVPSLSYLFISWFLIKKWCLVCALLYLLSITLVIVCFRGLMKVGSLADIGAGFGVLLGLCLSPLFIVGLLLSCITSAYLPTVFTVYVLQPAVSEAAIREIYDKWKSNPVRDIPIYQTEDPTKKDFIIGSENAAVTVIEFSDFECPFCERAAAVLKPYVQENSKNVRLVYKSFPLDKLCNPDLTRASHQLACQAAVTARCAGLVSDKKFWDMHDALFELTAEEWDVEVLRSLPESLGLDADTINQCVSSGEMLERVREDVQAGKNAEVRYTPSIYIQNRLVEFQRLDQLPKLIEYISRHDEN